MSLHAATVGRLMAPATQGWEIAAAVSTLERLSLADAAMACSGMDGDQLAAFMWVHARCEEAHHPLYAYLMMAAERIRTREHWSNGRLQALVLLAIEEMRLSADGATQMLPTQRYRAAGISETQWYALWNQRYNQVLAMANALLTDAELTLRRAWPGDE